MNFNKVFVAGHLTRDVEVRYSQDGKAFAKFGIAVNHKYGEKESVLFLDCTCFGKQAETLAEYCQKGSPLFIEGRLNQSNWDDKDTGQKRSKIDLIVERFQFLGEGKKSRSEKPAASGEQPPVEYGDIPF